MKRKKLKSVQYSQHFQSGGYIDYGFLYILLYVYINVVYMPHPEPTWRMSKPVVKAEDIRRCLSNAFCGALQTILFQN